MFRKEERIYQHLFLMGIFPSRILELLEEKSWGRPSVALVDEVLVEQVIFFFLDFFSWLFPFFGVKLL